MKIMVEIEVDKVLLKRHLKLFFFRVIVLGSHYIAVMDALVSIPIYEELKSKSSGNATKVATSALLRKNETVIKRPAKIELCDLKRAIPQKDIDSLLLNFNMSFFILLGFYGIAGINFIVKTIVNFRLIICPIWQEPDALGRVPPTIWDKIRDQTFNIATFSCDMAIMSCIVGLYAAKRGSKGLACWECFNTPTCNSVKALDKIKFMSSLSLNLNFVLVLMMVFYKGFIAYFRQTDPEKCDCHCVVPRCVTGCFVSLVITSVVMMPPFLVMDTKYFKLKGIKPGFVAGIMEKMRLVGIIIWAVAGIFIFIVVPLKMILLRNKDPKKK